MQQTNVGSRTHRMAEGAMCLALSLALSYLKIPVGVSFGGFGGSVDLVMVPLIVFAVRWGAGWGALNGLALGTLKYFLAGGTAISWVSLLLDYGLAYGAVGFAGLLGGLLRMEPYNGFSQKKAGDGNITHPRAKNGRERLIWALAALLGGLCRFGIHYISGVTVYAQYMPEEFMGLSMPSPALYSLLYNGTYMLPNVVLAMVSAALLAPVWKRNL